MHDADNDAKRYLESLGEPPLPPRLWQRVEGARRQRMRRRLGVASASVVALALAFALVLPGRAPAPEGGPLLADGAADDADRMHTVHVIDRALQAAYDRNAGDDEIEPLWRARQALVRAAGITAPRNKG